MNNQLIIGFLVTTAFLYLNQIRHIEGIPHPLKTVDAKGLFLPKGQQILGADDCDKDFCLNGNMPNGAWADPSDCSKYYGCWGYDTWCYNCTGDYQFDTKYSGCNYPRQTDCGTRPRKDGIANPAPATTAPPPVDFNCCQCKNSTTCQELYSYPENSSQFMHCVNDKQAYVKDCPAGLYYSVIAYNCDYNRDTTSTTCSPGYNTTTATTTTNNIA